MNIFNYSDFLIDLKLYFSESCENFNFNFNLALNSNEKPVNNFVFLENDHCIVCIDNISSFPYPDITITFYLKIGFKLIELNQTELWKSLNLNEEVFSNFYNSHQAKFRKQKDFSDEFYGAYKYGMKFNNDLFIHFFSPLLNGKITNEELLKMAINKF